MTLMEEFQFGLVFGACALGNVFDLKSETPSSSRKYMAGTYLNLDS